MDTRGKEKERWPQTMWRMTKNKWNKLTWPTQQWEVEQNGRYWQALWPDQGLKRIKTPVDHSNSCPWWHDLNSLDSHPFKLIFPSLLLGLIISLAYQPFFCLLNFPFHLIYFWVSCQCFWNLSIFVLEYIERNTSWFWCFKILSGCLTLEYVSVLHQELIQIIGRS